MQGSPAIGLGEWPPAPPAAATTSHHFTFADQHHQHQHQLHSPPPVHHASTGGGAGDEHLGLFGRRPSVPLTEGELHDAHMAAVLRTPPLPQQRQLHHHPPTHQVHPYHQHLHQQFMQPPPPQQIPMQSQPQQQQQQLPLHQHDFGLPMPPAPLPTGLQSCKICHKMYDLKHGLGPYCSHSCVEQDFNADRKQVKSEAKASTPRRKQKVPIAAMPLAAQLVNVPADMTPIEATTMIASPSRAAEMASADTKPKRKRAPSKKLHEQMSPQPIIRAKQEIVARPTVSIGAVPASVLLPPPSESNLHEAAESRRHIPMAKVTSGPMQPHLTPRAAMASSLTGVPAATAAMTLGTSPRSAMPSQPQMEVTSAGSVPAAAAATNMISGSLPALPVHAPAMPHSMTTRRMSMEPTMAAAAAASSSHPMDTTGSEVPPGPQLSLPFMPQQQQSAQLTSPRMYAVGGFDSPRSIFRQTGGQHSFMHHDPSPEPPSPAIPSMPMHYRSHHAAMNMKNLDVPMQAMTVSFAMRTPLYLPQSRRSSISKSMETDEEPGTSAPVSDEEHHGMSSAASTPRGVLPLSSNTALPAMTIHSTASSSAGSSGFPTPTSMSGSHFGTPPSSAPTTPMRRFFPFASIPVVTLVPSPRMESRLQQAASLTLGSRARLKQELGSKHADEEDEDLTDSAAEREADAAVSAARRKKRVRRDRDPSRSKKKKRTPKAGGVPSLKTVASALERVSRISRRKSGPPAVFGEGEEGSADAASGERDDSPESDLPKDKECEQCSRKHTGAYGGGRFCGAHCARHYSIVHRWEKKQGR